MSEYSNINEVDVWFKGEHVGILSQEGLAKFIFRYDEDAPYDISETMPRSEGSFEQPYIHPVFQMSAPEGDLRDSINESIRKDGKSISELGLLAYVGSKQIGCLNFSKVGEGVDITAVDEPVDISIINKAHNEFEAFDELMGTHLRSGVSGAQPKFLSAMEDALSSEEKTTFRTSEYIVKTFDPDKYPCLTVVEDLCMKMAAKSGINVAETTLSNQGNVLFVKRFDLNDDPSGFPYLRFEESGSLLGKITKDKYESSYEKVWSKMEELGCGDDDAKDFYRQFVFNSMIRNGDAHLKNFGYTFDEAGKATPSPAYDIVATGTWFINESMALSANGSKAWPTNDVMLKFGVQGLGLRRGEAKEIMEDVRSSIIECKDEMIAEYGEKYEGLAYIEEAMSNLSMKIDVGVGAVKEKHIHNKLFNFTKKLGTNKSGRQFKTGYSGYRNG